MARVSLDHEYLSQGTNEAFLNDVLPAERINPHRLGRRALYNLDAAVVGVDLAFLPHMRPSFAHLTDLLEFTGLMLATTAPLALSGHFLFQVVTGKYRLEDARSSWKNKATKTATQLAALGGSLALGYFLVPHILASGSTIADIPSADWTMLGAATTGILTLSTYSSFSRKPNLNV